MGQQWHSFLSLMIIEKAILESVIEACREGSERGGGPGHPRQEGIERVKLQKL